MRRLSLILFLLAPVEAFAQTAAQERFTRNIALLMYGESRCPKLRVNMLIIAQLAPTFKLKPADWAEGGRLHRVLASQYQTIKETFAQESDDVVCGMIEDGFGPDGTIAPGVIKRR